MYSCSKPAGIIQAVSPIVVVYSGFFLIGFELFSFRNVQSAYIFFRIFEALSSKKNVRYEMAFLRLLCTCLSDFPLPSIVMGLAL